MIRPAPGLPIEQQSERVVIRLLLWGETRGEEAIGKLAVLWVVANRAMRSDTSLKAQALKPWQFSTFNANDPNRDKLLRAHEIEPAAWGACDAVAALWEYKATVDPTLGATHYYNPAVAQPPWGRGHEAWEETIIIGAHVFGRAA